MPPRAHNILSPSAAHRWFECPASALLEDGYPDSTSYDSALGTAVHDMCERSLVIYKETGDRDLADPAKQLGREIVVAGWDESFADREDGGRGPRLRRHGLRRAGPPGPGAGRPAGRAARDAAADPPGHGGHRRRGDPPALGRAGGDRLQERSRLRHRQAEPAAHAVRARGRLRSGEQGVRRLRDGEADRRAAELRRRAARALVGAAAGGADHLGRGRPEGEGQGGGVDEGEAPGGRVVPLVQAPGAVRGGHRPRRADRHDRLRPGRHHPRDVAARRPPRRRCRPRSWVLSWRSPRW